MQSSDEHLEEALSQYNDKISVLESKGPAEDLLEALVNRSTILILMESFVSSLTDLEEAIDLINLMESQGKKIDIGTYVKVYENRGQLSYGEDDEMMSADYAKIASKLDDIKGNIRHYNEDEVIEMCIGCAEDLQDKNRISEAMPFTSKALKMLAGADDDWSLNRMVEAYNLVGQADMNIKSLDKAIDAFSKSIEIGKPLFKKSKLDDEMELVFSYVFKGDIEEEKNNMKAHIEDHESAISILEEINTEGKLEDLDLLVNLHQGLATVLMDSGNVKEAEHHLLRVMDLGMPAMKDAITELGIKRNNQ